MLIPKPKQIYNFYSNEAEIEKSIIKNKINVFFIFNEDLKDLENFNSSSTQNSKESLKENINQNNIKENSKESSKESSKEFNKKNFLEIIQKEEIIKLIKKYVEFENYTASSTSILHLVEYDVILLGMGKITNWNPEIFCETFRNLGAKFSASKSVYLKINFRKDLEEILNNYKIKDKEIFQKLALNFNRTKENKEIKEDKKNNSNNKAKNDNDKDDEKDKVKLFEDYITLPELEDLIIQLIVCMNLGAENMELLKSKNLINKDNNAKKVSENFKEILLDTTDLLNYPEQKTKTNINTARNLTELLNGFRYLASLPGNYLTPKTFEEYSRELASDYKIKIKVIQEEELEKLGFGGIVSVGRGSVIPPRFIILEYQPKSFNLKNKMERPLVLVGKGITFDTGGISLKPAGEMHEMKYDMCGAALALHGVALASTQKLNYPVIALIGLAENMPDGNAIKPGDVYTAYDGTTIEIQNTDAEGRLVLGDLLAYAVKNYDPLCMLDFATLTGACIIALGHEAAAVMTSSDELFNRINLAHLKSLEHIWRLPHWSVYGKGLKSDIADQRNIAGRAAGTVSAMRFLAQFVPEEREIPWAHFDIAGTSWRDKPNGTQTKGATGWGLRLLFNFFNDLDSDVKKN